MNKLYNNHTKKGARVRVLGTNELGTVAEKHLIRKDGQTKVYCKVVLDKDPGQDTWYFAERLGDTKECATVKSTDDRGRTLILKVTKYYDKSEDNLNIVMESEDGSILLDHKCGLHFYLATLLLKALADESDE